MVRAKKSAKPATVVEEKPELIKKEEAPKKEEVAPEEEEVEFKGVTSLGTNTKVTVGRNKSGMPWKKGSKRS